MQTMEWLARPRLVCCAVQTYERVMLTSCSKDSAAGSSHHCTMAQRVSISARLCLSERKAMLLILRTPSTAACNRPSRPSSTDFE